MISARNLTIARDALQQLIVEFAEELNDAAVTAQAKPEPEHEAHIAGLGADIGALARSASIIVRRSRRN